MKFVRKFDLFIENISSKGLVFSLLTMLVLSCLSVVLRWFHTNLTWIDPFVRHLVFLSAFFGGVLATGRGTHIGIDLLGKIVETKGWHRLHLFIKRLIDITSTLTLIWLIKASIDFTKVEMEYGKEVFFGIMSGYLVMIIPIGLSLIAVRFFAIFILSFEEKKI